MDYTEAQLETALRQLYDSGRMDEARTVAEQLQKQRQAAKPQSDFAKAPYFPGVAFAYPPAKEDVEAGNRVTSLLFRQIPADVVSAPLQMVAGLGDVAANFVSRALGLPTPRPRATEETSKARNLLAGRPGEAPGPLTLPVQAAATTPIVGPGTLGAVVQGFGLGPSSTKPGEDLLLESAKMGAASGLTNKLLGLLGKQAPASAAAARLDDIANQANVERTYGMKTGSALARNLEARAERNVLLGGLGSKNYAQGLHEKIDDQMARAIWNKAGQNFDEFTQDTINSATRDIGAKLELPFKGKEIPFTGMRLQTAVDNAIGKTYDMSRPDELMKAAVLVDNKLLQGKINASDMNVIVDDLRGLATKAYNDNNKVAGDAIRALYDEVRANAIAAIPDAAGRATYKKALTEYANLQTIKDAFVRSAESPRGNLDFTKLKAAIERNMPGGYTSGRADLTGLADLGLSMRSSDVINEGIKVNPIDASLYFALNNPVSRLLRDRSPMDAALAQQLLRPVGIQLGQ